jgi:hypothetical protein
VCLESIQECRASDLSGVPGDTRTHLQFMYDLREIRSNDRENFDHELEVYALNRYLAPFRDNKNKKEGKSADRTYKSRNETGARALANLCGFVGPRGMKCIRQPHPTEPDRHRY